MNIFHILSDYENITSGLQQVLNTTTQIPAKNSLVSLLSAST